MASTLRDGSGDGAVTGDTLPELDRISVDTIPAVIIQLAARLAAAQRTPTNVAVVMPKLPEQLLSLEEVAGLLKLPKSSAYELARRGDITTIRVGKKYLRVRRADFDAYVSARAQASLDNGLNVTLSSGRAEHRGRGNPLHPTTSRPHARGIRAARRRALGDGQPVGERDVGRS